MKGLLLALAMAGLSATAYGATALAADPVERTLGHVKRLERHNKFHLKQRMGGGAFKLGGTYEPEVAPDDGWGHARWDATGVLTVDGGTGYGLRWRCTVDVKVRRTATGAVRWRRHVVACAQQLRSAP